MEINGIDIGLPSRGLLYDVSLENIKIRTLKGKDEKILAEMNIENIEAKYAALLSSVVSGIDANQLTLGDRTHILLWERINSYSPNFPAEFLCELCYQKIVMPLDLTTINSKPLPEGFKEPYSVVLGDGTSLSLKLFRVLDEIRTLDWEKKLGQSSAYMYRWATSLVDNRDIPTRISYLENLDVADLVKIKKFHEDHAHGPELDSVPYKCPKCGGDGHLTLPFRPDFLIPSSKDVS